jgi:endonuclease-3
MTSSQLLKDRKQRMARIMKILASLFPVRKTMLAYRNPFELLIAVILSAQCTDAQVNKVTPSLFKKYPNPR